VAEAQQAIYSYLMATSFGRTTALLACECQSFLDNVIAGLRQIGAWE
jgi:hypothetical protein